MGYDLHITRKQDWCDEEGPIISLEDWLKYVATDIEIERDPNNGRHDFLYVKHSGESQPLWWARGEVFTKNPDKETVKKLIGISHALCARVLGDDGESYSDWTTFPSPDAPPERAKSKGFFNRLLGR